MREALQIVEHQGLVTKIPRVGTFVTKLSDKEVAQIYRVRLELEPLAAELASEGLDETGGNLLQQMADRLVTSERLRDYAQYVRALLDLHRSIWQLSGNRFLEKALLDMSRPLFAWLLIRENRSGPPNIGGVTQRHCTLVSLIKSRNVAKAREFCRHVVQQSWENTMRKLEEIAPGSVEPKTAELAKLG